MQLVCFPGISEGNSKFLKKCVDLGFENMYLDLAFCNDPGMLEHQEELFEKHADRYKYFLPKEPERMEEAFAFHLAECKRFGVPNLVAGSTFIPDDSKRHDLDEQVKYFVSKSIEICGKENVPYLIIRQRYPHIKKATERQANIDYYMQFAEAAKKAGITILIPNVYDTHNGHCIRGLFSDPYEIIKFIDELNEKAGKKIFASLLDTGVCNMLGQDFFEYITILGDYINAVHLRENNGFYDTTTMPFTALMGTESRFDWLGFFRGLRAIAFDGPLLYDFSAAFPGTPGTLQNAQLRYQAEIAKYVKWQVEMEQTIKKYDKRVLFGAGNMCRAYMKCYGEEFKPLYTCDNNSARWGQTFEGLEIKNPEELKQLPENVAIFLCNVYYDEIEKQLREMGLKNPIERFNDEFMPSFYFEKLEYWQEGK